MVPFGLEDDEDTDGMIVNDVIEVDGVRSRSVRVIRLPVFCSKEAGPEEADRYTVSNRYVSS